MKSETRSQKAESAEIDRTIKLKLYARFGVREYWLIDPEKPSAEIYRAGEKGLELSESITADNSLSSPLLPGFAVPLSKLVD